MFRASRIPKEFFESRIVTASDSLFMCRIVDNHKVFVIKEELTAYRVHDSHARKIGYKLDSLLSHSFIEYYFPHCIPDIIKRKAAFYRMNATSAFLSNDDDLGLKLLKASMSYKLTLKSVLMFILAKLGQVRSLYHLIKRFS